MSHGRGALDGVRVLDLSRFIAGPLCSQILGDLGAEVIKVERPGGEDARKHEPFFQGESVYTMLYNRNKQGVTLDTRHPRALAILEDLVRWADVVVENYRPGTMDSMGLSYERLEELKPGIILVSISGFGQTGPLAQRGLFDAIAQAASGLMSMTGEHDAAPTLTGTYIADYIAGYHGAIGALAALQHRTATGEGQHVDVASVDALFSTLGTAPSAYRMLGQTTTRTGSRDRFTGPANVFEARDGFVYIHAGTDPLFPRMMRVIGREDLIGDARYDSVPKRMAAVDALERLIADWAAERDIEAIGEALSPTGIPFGRVETVEAVTDSAQIAAREMMVDVEHPTLGTLQIPGIPIKLGGSPATVRKAPPTVGEDNDTVYRDILGIDDDGIRNLREEGVI